MPQGNPPSPLEELLPRYSSHPRFPSFFWGRDGHPGTGFVWGVMEELRDLDAARVEQLLSPFFLSVELAFPRVLVPLCVVWDDLLVPLPAAFHAPVWRRLCTQSMFQHLHLPLLERIIANRESIDGLLDGVAGVAKVEQLLSARDAGQGGPLASPPTLTLDAQTCRRLLKALEDRKQPAATRLDGSPRPGTDWEGRAGRLCNFCDDLSTLLRIHLGVAEVGAGGEGAAAMGGGGGGIEFGYIAEHATYKNKSRHPRPSGIPAPAPLRPAAGPPASRRLPICAQLPWLVGQRRARADPRKAAGRVGRWRGASGAGGLASQARGGAFLATDLL